METSGKLGAFFKTHVDIFLSAHARIETLVSSTLIMQCPAARKLIHGRLSSSKFASLIPFSLSFTLSLCMVPNFATLVGHTL